MYMTLLLYVLDIQHFLVGCENNNIFFYFGSNAFDNPPNVSGILTDVVC